MSIMDNNIQDMPSEELVVDNIFCNNIMYLPLKDAEVKEGDSINEIIDKVNSEAIPKLSPEEQKAAKDQIQYIEDMIAKNPDLKNMTISDLSWADSDNDKKDDHPYNGMQAAVFHKGDDKYVTYRGTPDGSWIDNAEIIIGSFIFGRVYTDRNGNKLGPISRMQKESLEYMDNIRNKYAEEWEDCNVHVSGHSKGDIFAALAMILNSDFIDDCVGINGPGLSPEAERKLKSIIGDKAFRETQDRMYKFCEINDYVNVFGRQLYKRDNIYWYKGIYDPKDIYQAHLISAIYDIEEGVPAPLQDEQGYIGRFLRNMYEDIEKLPPQERIPACLGIMYILQEVVNKERAVGKDEAYYLSISSHFPEGLRNIKDILIRNLNTEDGLNMIAYLKKSGLIDEIIDSDATYVNIFFGITRDKIGSGIYLRKWLKSRNVEELRQEIIDRVNVFYPMGMFVMEGFDREDRRIRAQLGINSNITLNRKDNAIAEKMILKGVGITAINYTNLSNLLTKLDEYITEMDIKYIADAEAIKEDLKNLRNKVKHAELDNLIYNYEIQKKGLDSYKFLLDTYKLKCEEVEKKFIEDLNTDINREYSGKYKELYAPYYFEH